MTPQLMNCKACPNLLFIYDIGFEYYLLVTNSLSGHQYF